MSFKEFHTRQKSELHEVLNSKVDYQVKRNTETRFNTTAVIGDRRIEFDSELYDEDTNLWEVAFMETDMDGKGSGFGITGSGKELEVFSMVRASMEELIRLRNPSIIKFTASKYPRDGVRADLYERLLRRFAADKYTIERNSIDRNEDVFILTRKG